MATINVRAKGQTGEQEIAKLLNKIIDELLVGSFKLPPMDPKKPYVQRNQNQSAVGGSDLTNTFNLAIEVKRQETLSINTWWKQCTDAAAKYDQTPILLYRQNHQPWICVMEVELPVPGCREPTTGRAEVSLETFLWWFRRLAFQHMIQPDCALTQAARVQQPQPQEKGPDLYGA